MIGKQIIILLFLSFLAVVTLAAPLAKTAYINRFGKFVDLDSECNGKPCNYPKEIVPFSSQELSGPICLSTTNDQVICNSLPPNATLVSESDFDRIFPESDGSTSELRQDPIFDPAPGVTPSEAPQVSASIGSPLQPSQTSKPSQISHSRLVSNATLLKRAESPKLEKRSKLFINNEGTQYIWPKRDISYGIASSAKLSTQIPLLRRTVQNGMELWSRSCFPEASNFFAEWRPTKYDTADFWFYFVDAPVCGEGDAAVACAFTPEQYSQGLRSTIYVNYSALVKKTDVGMELSMAHEIGHIMGLAHEVRGPREDVSPIRRLSEVDEYSIMHPLYNSQNYITKTDCRIFKFYSENFQNIRCGFEGSTGKCKKEPKERHVIEPVERKLKLNEKMIGSEYGVAELMEDVADRNCIGSDPDKYILNNPYIDKEKGSGYVRRGFVLTQCLGIQDKRYPYMYVLQSDGNFVSYDIKKKKAIWSTKSQGRGTKGSYSMAFQLDGNLVIYDAKGDPTWNSNTWRGSPDSFRVNVFYWYFKGGQMFLADSSGRNAWGTYPVIAHSAQRIEAKEADGAHSEYCLDLSGELRKCNGSKEQAFDIFTDGTIRNVASGQCLYASRPENATPISIGKCVVIDKSYLWQFPHIEGEFTQGVIVNQGAGKCLDNRAQKLVDGNVIQVFQCYDVWSEYWWIGGVP